MAAIASRVAGAKPGIHSVIDRIIKQLPENESSFIDALKQLSSDSIYAHQDASAKYWSRLLTIVGEFIPEEPNDVKSWQGQVALVLKDVSKSYGISEAK